MNRILWLEIDAEKFASLDDNSKYKELVDWSAAARCNNPDAFDDVTRWLLNDGLWNEAALDGNKHELFTDLLDRFRLQNALLRDCLSCIKTPGIINTKVFDSIDVFDAALNGDCGDEKVRAAYRAMSADFSVMTDRSIREQIAGGITGSTGTDSVEIFGFINCIKGFDAGVQWALFMPRLVEEQQKGFHVARFEYKKASALKFIGIEAENTPLREIVFKTLDELNEYKSELSFDVCLKHHYGLGVNLETEHHFWGRFMKENTPVPDGFTCFDFVTKLYEEGFKDGPPYLSQFAYAEFCSDTDNGFNTNNMYDVTRNIMLGQGVPIPYPEKYWTAEVFLNGADKKSSAYMFSALL